MPMDKAYVETGLLVADGRALYPRRDDGGHWRLDAPRSAWRLLGSRVRIEGTRSGFNWLSVRKVEPANIDPA